MDPRTRAWSRRRLAVPLLLAIALAVEASGAALAVPRRAAEAGGLVSAPGAAVEVRVRAGTGHGGGSAQPIADWARSAAVTVSRVGAARQAATRATPAAVALVEPIARATTTASSGYRGTNHVWIPALGINRAVAFFPCSRTKPPGHQVYSWGCAGSNNVYLFAHAATVFKPLHDAYVRGRLRKGMEVVYADGNGRISRYAVSWWKVTPPDGDVGWAYAGQSVPSMTLQTCVGSDSAYRLVVRLVRKG